MASSSLTLPKATSTKSFWESLPPRIKLPNQKLLNDDANHDAFNNDAFNAFIGLGAMRELLEGLKKDIVADLERIMQQQLDGNVKAIESLIKRGSDFSTTKPDSGLPGPLIDHNGEDDRVRDADVADRLSRDASLLGEIKIFEEKIGSDGQTLKEVDELDDQPLRIRGDIQKSEEVVKSLVQLRRKRHEFAVSCSVNEEEVGLPYSAILEAVVNGPIEALTHMLEEQNLDPNLVLNDIKINGRSWNHCSLLAAAVMTQQVDHISLLVKMNANIESTYGFNAGTDQSISWSGPAAHITFPKNDTSMLKLLLSLRADPDVQASNGANMVWQCAYFGQHDMLQQLLLSCPDLPIAALNRPADYQNDPGIAYSPLHISIVMGHQWCTRVLVGAKAQIESRNERNDSPLDCAIRNNHPELVTFLVQEGAQFRSGRHSGASSKEDKAKSEPWKSSSEALFLKPNPVLVHALALGFQSQPGQTEQLTLGEIFAICETDTRSMIAMLQAMFVERRIRYRAKDAKKGVRERNTAVVRKSETFAASEYVYKYPIVLSSKYKFNDLKNLDKSRSVVNEDLRDFIGRLIPHGDKHHKLPKGYVYTHVVVYECLVPAIHQDLRYLKLLADANRMSKIYLNSHCQAMVAYAWSRAKMLAVVQCFAHFMMLLFFFFIAVQIREKEASFVQFQEYVNLAAIMVMPFWLFEAIMEMLELKVHYEHGWTRDYLLDERNFFDCLRLVADGAGIFSCIFFGVDATEELLFRCFLGGLGFFKWTKMLYCLTPFRSFGVPVMPILFALNNIGSSVAIMVVYFSGMAHGLVALNVIPASLPFTVLRAFMFGIGGDIGSVHQIDGIHESEFNEFDRWWFQLILVFALFAAPITFMNIFIAAMSNSYETGITHAEQLYQNRCVEGTFSHSCVIYALRKRCARPRAEASRLWYCRERGEAALDRSVCL